LTCKGVSGILAIKGGSMSFKDGKLVAQDVNFCIASYSHEMAPFGVAYFRGVMAPAPGAGNLPTSVAECTLSRTGTNAKSVLPEQK
jgi:hypothetical protein